MDSSMFIGSWWALIPPILAIVLAFITKEVYSSLLAGIIVGVLFYTGFQPWDAFNALFDIMKNNMNLNILIFDILLGMIIVLMHLVFLGISIIVSLIYQKQKKTCADQRR